MNMSVPDWMVAYAGERDEEIVGTSIEPGGAHMAEVLLFHHAQGLTPGIHAFADDLRAAGHRVHTPDLFDGQTFGSIDEGMAHIQSVGFDEYRSRGVALANDYPPELVYGGFSFGEAIAQQLAQTRPGAKGALLFYSCIPITGEWAFGPWPDGVPVQIHGMDHDPFFADEGDIDAAREIVATVPDAELFVYPGDQHYFADSSLPSYDADATVLLTERVLEFLARV
jgi:dienelactone hydrolase